MLAPSGTHVRTHDHLLAPSNTPSPRAHTRSHGCQLLLCCCARLHPSPRTHTHGHITRCFQIARQVMCEDRFAATPFLFCGQAHTKQSTHAPRSVSALHLTLGTFAHHSQVRAVALRALKKAGAASAPWPSRGTSPGAQSQDTSSYKAMGWYVEFESRGDAGLLGRVTAAVAERRQDLDEAVRLEAVSRASPTAPPACLRALGVALIAHCCLRAFGVALTLFMQW